MSSTSVDHVVAQGILEAAWVAVADKSFLPAPALAASIEAVITGTSVTYRYILITGLLAKSVNPLVNARALQTSSALEGAFDARSLCHAVVVPFEKTKGDLWGLSNEPFVSKPARHPEHDSANPQLKNKLGAKRVHDILEHVNGHPDEAFCLLVHSLRLGLQRAESQVHVEGGKEANHRRVTEFVARFLETADGGSRLAAVTGAFVTLMNEDFDVRVYATSASDKFGGTAGDVEIHSNIGLISAFECKHRPIDPNDIQHGIEKAKKHGIFEYWFVLGSGFAANQELLVEQEVNRASEELDVYLVQILNVVDQWTALLNPMRRAAFGEIVERILRDEMKRSEVANEAAQLWNSIE